MLPHRFRFSIEILLVRYQLKINAADREVSNSAPLSTDAWRFRRHAKPTSAHVKRNEDKLGHMILTGYPGH